MQVVKKIYFRTQLNYILHTMESTSVSPEGNSKNNRGIVIILTILIGLLSALSGYLYFQLNTLKADSVKLRSMQDQANKDIDVYRGQLKELTTKYDSLIQAHEGLKTELGQEREKVVVLMRDYERLKSAGETVHSEGGRNLKARLDELQQAYDENEAIILELKAKNQELTDENFKAMKQVEELNTENTKLTEENGKLNKTVDIAKRLKTYEVYADAVKLNSSRTKEKATPKARKADRIRVCFTLMDNMIADKQEKIIYAVIKTPGGKILSTGDKSMIKLLNGSEIAYSIKKEIFYDNKVMQLCMNWDAKSDEAMESGNYKVELYAEGVKIGDCNFDLK